MKSWNLPSFYRDYKKALFLDPYLGFFCCVAHMLSDMAMEVEPKKSGGEDWWVQEVELQG